MFFDILVLGLALMAILKGWRNGFVLALFSFVAFIAGVLAALKLSAVAAQYIGKTISVPERWLPFVAFAAVFLLVVFLVRLGAKVIEGVLNLAMLGWLNRLCGIVLYGLIYLYILSVFLFYAMQLHIVKPYALQSSATYSYIQPLAPKLIRAAGHVFPFFKNMLSELEQFFKYLSINTFAK